jgi:nucleoside-diphosphate-sugar epimerase
MKILITGATGFIGKRLSQRLVEEGHDIICTGRRLYSLRDLSSSARLSYLDIEDIEAIKNILKKERPDIVFHCAALVSNCCLPRLMRINRDGTYNLFEACRIEKIKKVVYLSSIAVISGNPEIPLNDELPYAATNRYGQSKIAAERIALSYRSKGMGVSVIRPVMVYGENEPHLLGLICRLIRWRVIPVISNNKTRIQLACVDNVVDIMMLALKTEKAFENTYIAADKEALEVNEFFEYIAECQKVKPPFSLSQRLIPLLQKIPLMEKRISFFTKDRIYSIDNVREKLGYTPRIDVHDGLERAVKSYEKR